MASFPRQGPNWLRERFGGCETFGHKWGPDINYLYERESGPSLIYTKRICRECGEAQWRLGGTAKWVNETELMKEVSSRELERILSFDPSMIYIL